MLLPHPAPLGASEPELDADVDADALAADGEVTEQPDGSAIVEIPEAANDVVESKSFDENLAKTLDQAVLNTIAAELMDLIDADKTAREDRDKKYEEGLRRTGLGDDAPGGASFAGASRVVHPILAECCVDFTARASKELLPPDGPVKAKVVGEQSDEKLEKADRKKRHMNWQLTEQIPEYEAEMERLLSQLPLGGSQYLKIRWDQEQGRIVPEFVPIDYVYLPYSATSYRTSWRKTEKIELTHDQFSDRVESGQYADINLGPTTMMPAESAAEEANDKIEGKEDSGTNDDGLRVLWETQVLLSVETDPKAGGIRSPYVVTIDHETGKIVSMRRNWEERDPKHLALEWVVEFPFIPWRGAQSIGLPQLIGSLSAAMTGALRALLDTAHISNSATMLKLKGAKIGGQSNVLAIGTTNEIEGGIGVDDIRKIAMPVPFNPPNPVLFELLGWLDSAAKGVVTTAEEKIADAGNNMPVGTALALIEQGSKVYSSIHKRLHSAQKRVLGVIHRLNAKHLEDREVIEDMGGLVVSRRDYEGAMDVIPVSDPNIFSEAQRTAQNQMILQMSQLAPAIYDQASVHRRILTGANIQNIDEVLKVPSPPERQDPVSENMAMMLGKPVKAFPDEDHEAHIKSHVLFSVDPTLGSSALFAPVIAGPMTEHLKQHMALFYVKAYGEIVAKAAQQPAKSLMMLKGTKAQNAAANAFVEAAPILHKALFPKVFGVVEQAIKQVQDIAKQVGPKPPMDPSQVAMAEVSRKSQKDQTDAQLAMQKLEADKQGEIAKLQGEAQKAEMQHAQAMGKLQTELEWVGLDKQKLTLQAQQTVFDLQNQQQQLQRDYEAKIAELQAKVEDANRKFEAQAALQQQKLDHEGAVADMNNESREAMNAADNATALELSAMRIDAGLKGGNLVNGNTATNPSP